MNLIVITTGFQTTADGYRLPIRALAKTGWRGLYNKILISWWMLTRPELRRLSK